MKHQLAQCQLLIMPPSQEARPQPKFTAAKAAAKRWEPDPPRGIPTAQANLISLAVRRQHLAEMLLVKIACITCTFTYKILQANPNRECLKF